MLKEETPYTWSNFKLQNCQNLKILPAFYTQQAHEETLECIIHSKAQWDDYLKQRVESLQKVLERPIIKRRAEAYEPEKKDLEESKEDDKGDEAKEDYESESAAPGSTLYDSTTFLNAILKIKSTNYEADPALAWGSIKVMLQTRTLEELRQKFSELNIALRQVGIDEEKGFLDERLLIGEKLLQKNAVPLFSQFAKRGIPHTLRPAIYRKILNSDYGEKASLYFDRLQDHYAKWELIIDDIVKFDIKDFCNDDKYFIFEDVIHPILSSFFRDPYILTHCRVTPNKPLIGYNDKGKSVGHFPPAGVLPCSSFARYIGPFTYIIDKTMELYYVFRGLYIRHLCYLHSISSSSQGIIALVRLFEDLLQIYEPEVWFHMQQIGVSPLKVAFPWIFYAFSGYLEVEQVMCRLT
eukprot:TRINITY_DN12656_c0_g1_i11.p1 TRINITY_DN12656_c0_g1~~TRINITY_DN12656_c0_g1_i11.p1  ORF type:complete len:409 (+),score=127.26 TRINITY_DN12656_c0_g1_i11:119-1345(+)